VKKGKRFSVNDLRQRWPMPKRSRPIVILATGGIVQTCHLPAYREAGFTVAGVFNRSIDRARETARRFRIPRVFSTLSEAARFPGAVFDLATPPDIHLEMLRKLPPKSAVLIQKPMGLDLKQARQILALCREKRFAAAINFQLRFSPNMLAIRDLIRRGLLGRLTGVEVRVNLFTPWAQWTFLKGAPRMEILYHSIHYLDLIRSLLGEPKAVYCHIARHPLLKDYSDVGNDIVLDYGKWLRCSVHTNHNFPHGPKHTMVQFMIQGLKGAAIAHMEQKLNRPDFGGADRLEVALGGSKWQKVKLAGDWFPDAFQGPMANLQRVLSGEDKVLHTSVEDCAKTMALVEALYISSRKAGTPLPKI
jgi:predicted dehydrogenase